MIYDNKRASQKQRRSRNLRPREDPTETNQRWPGLPTHDNNGIPYPSIEPTDLPADIVLPRLRKVIGHGPTWSCCCPAHHDQRPSLAITETHDRKLLIYCHAGCCPKDIMVAIGLDLSFLYPSSFALKFGQCTGRERRFSNHAKSHSVTDPNIDNIRFDRILYGARNTPKVCDLACQLNLPASSLEAIGVGYLSSRKSWVFAERDWKRRVVGLVYRTVEGNRFSETGSKRGLTIPNDIDNFRFKGPIYLPEGATDAAAIHSIGSLAIARPAAAISNLCQEWLAKFIAPYQGRQIIVVADRDTPKNGRHPGIEGAVALAEHLRIVGHDVKWLLPAAPFTDIREQIVSGKWNRGLTRE